MADEGLSQEDFRKLLQTPRPGSETSSTYKFKAPPPKAQRNEGSAVFAKPTSLKNKKKRHANDDEKKSTTQRNYRDRAAERRVGEQQQEPSEDQQTTEDLLRPMEQNEALDAQQVYEQSKYLGGDIQHTHLVKGLDFTLLNKVRQQIREREEKNAMATSPTDDMDGNQSATTETATTTVTEEQAEDVLDNVLDRLDRGENMMTENINDALSMQDKNRLSATAKSLQALFAPSMTTKPIHELFRPGRMAFLFPMNTSDPFAMPTAVIRSKADLQQRKTSSQLSGWSDDALEESELVLSKVAQVMVRNRLEQQQEQERMKQLQQQQEAALTKKSIAASSTTLGNNMMDDDDDDDNLIFSDVEGDYSLDEAMIEQRKQQQQKEEEKVKEEKSTTMQRTNYFMDNDDTRMEDTVTVETGTSSISGMDNVLGAKRKYQAGPEDILDADSQDIDMFGLSTTALPTSFTDRQRMVLDEEEVEEEDDDKKKQQATLLIDQGTHKNKKAQLSRWDFDDEEQWQQYKATVEIQPKSAAQFGVKMSDGRKRNKERRVMTEKQKLNREYQQVKGIMEKKYGKG
ncbi:RED-like protein N-terminal region-domain-containing protein [Halteromyces radiatus]|uniref:RED-like protein N-terminal region-domain-containing protein n=1 Tax=Halteromyces radiatus TaxID=101107 RepID=UPI00221FE087|nr:RED-like protein N-terminal region-domain-containing protein [Halteromyces radiatus]KAI8086333.1 RED-like protein N-terminal region-domain-containing protein [Halteromyces radiatus]